MEKNNAQDIETYLRHQPIGFHLQEQIMKRASGNFQWVKLVIEKVSQLLRKGKPLQKIQNMISSLPAELSRLYEGFLTNIEESDKLQSLKLLQWICFALRPLSLSELRLAMAVDEDTACLSILECQESELYVDTDDAMKKLVCDLSQGLAESTEHDGKRIVQLIHQSVDDFLREKGLQILCQSQSRALNDILLGCSHFRLSRFCIKYLSMSEIQDSDLNCPFKNTKRINQFKNNSSYVFPFLNYASTFWIIHAEIIEQQNIPQADIILYFYLNSQSPSDLFMSWTHIYAIFCDEYPPKWKAPCTLLHIASEYELLSVLQEALNQGTNPNSVD